MALNFPLTLKILCSLMQMEVMSEAGAQSWLRFQRYNFSSRKREPLYGRTEVLKIKGEHDNRQGKEKLQKPTQCSQFSSVY